MAKLIVDGHGEFDVPDGTRLVKALVDIAETDQLHACGGNSRCTTCRVQFVAGEPTAMTKAEKDTLSERGIEQTGVRLSCQVLCEGEMTVKLLSRLEGSGRADQGNPCDDTIQPEPEWV